MTPEKIETTLNKFEPHQRKYIKLIFRRIYNTSTYHHDNTTQLESNYYELATKMGFDIYKNNFLYHSCEACGNENTFYLMPDLSIWKCINDLDYDIPRIGEIQQDGDLLFNPDHLIEWRKLSDCFLDPKCINCKLLPDCLGGCILYNSKNKSRLCTDFELTSMPFMY